MRLGVIADVHGNLPALEAVMADLAARHVDGVVNLGDCVSGPLWPREALELLRAQDWRTVRGNHDRAVGASAGESRGPSDRYAFDALDQDARRWLWELPVTLDLGQGIRAFHACPNDDNRYLVEDQPGDRLVRAEPATIAHRLRGVSADIVLTAHSHRPAALKLPNGPWVINPGSVGCPAYDDDSTDPPHVSEQGSPAACYAVIELGTRGLAIERVTLPYDHDRAADRAAENGRPDWAYALRTGFALQRGARA